MRYLRRLRSTVALLLFAVVGLTIGGIDLYGTILLGTLLRRGARERRKAVARWQSRWSGCWYLLCRHVGGMRITFAFDASVADAAGPFIVIGNHFGAFDGLVIDRVLRSVGQYDYRPVAKNAMKGVPVMGRVWREMGIAFVKRDHRKSDADAVTRLAEVAREDGANVIIFPEGTVLTRENAADGPRTLLPTKFGGFRRLVKALPGYPILSLTLYWRDYDPYPLSDEGAVPPGTDLLVECRVLPPPERAEDAERVLREEWERKREWLRHAR